MNRIKSTIVVLVILSLILPVFSLPLVWGAEDSWTTLEPLPLERGGFNAIAFNEKIYVMKSNITYEYSLNSWSEKTAMLTPRYDFAITAYQDKIYCIGGKNDSTPLGTNEVYDPVTDTWETKASMPTPRHGLDANVVNGKIYLISGSIPHHLFPDVEGTFELTNITEVYDPVTNTWETRTPIPNPASYYASGVVKNKIYIISESYTQIYDPKTDTWSFGTPPLYSVDMAGGAATTGVLAPERIYIVGGRDSGLEGSGLEVPYTQIYNPIEDSWSLGTSMQTPRYYFAVAVLDDQIYTIGGLTGAFVTVEQKNQNEQYTPLGYIPEFPSCILFPILVTSTLVILIFKTKLKKKVLE